MHLLNIKKNTYQLCIIISLLALLLRLINLTKYDLWFDEISSLIEVNLNNFRYLSTNFPFQPLYNFLLKYWQILGDNLLVLRFSSVIFAVSSITLIYLLGRTIFSKRAGIICAFLLSISPFAIHYSQELRPPSFLIFLVLLSTYTYFRLLSESSFLLWLVNITTNVLSVYLVPTSIFIPVIQLLLMTFSVRKNRIKEVLLFQSTLLFLLLPWFYTTTGYFLIMLDITKVYRQFSPFISSVSLNNLSYSLKNFTSGYYASNIIRNIGFIFCLLLILKGIIDLFNNSKAKLYTLLPFLLIPILSLFIFSKFRPFYAERYLPFTIIFLYLIIGFSMSRLNKRLLIISLIVFCIISALSLNNYYSNRIFCNFKERQGTNAKKDFKKAAYFLKDNYRQGDLVIHTSETSILPLEYYFNKDSNKYFLKEKALSTCKFIMDCQINNRVKRFLIIHEIDQHRFYLYKDIRVFASQKNDTLIDKQQRIWLVLSHWEDPKLYSFVNDWFKDRYSLEKAGRFTGIEIYLYINKMQNNE